MEHIRITVGVVIRAPSLHLPTFPVLVAKLGGRVVAFCERHIPVRSLVGLPGTVRYVGADRTVGVHLDHEPINTITEYPRDLIRVVWGGHTLRAIEAYLATRPPVTADLDRVA